MDSLLIKERDKLDKVSRDALEQLIFKDQIIEELRSKLSKEQLENIGLKTKLKEWEEKINLLEEKLEKEENSSFTIQKNIFNTQNNSNNLNSSELKNLKVLSNEQQELIEKLKLENKDLNSKNHSLQGELEIWKEKSKAISEIEEIYKHQMEQLRKKAENSDFLQKKLKEKENYIEEIISRYNNLQNDYEIMINNKDYEIKELKAQLNVISENNEKFTNQINLLSQNSNNLSQELYKELRNLNEKNKDLEMKLFKTEQKYKDEVSGLRKILEESCTNNNSNINNNMNNNVIQENQSNTKNKLNNNVNLNDKNDLALIKHDSTSMRVEDLATSLSKSIREKIESQNKKITMQNIEILQLQYENEKLKSDLNYEKELNGKIQGALADLKCKNIQTQNRALFEEAQTQTTLKFDDLESFKIKAKILEDNLIRTSEENEQNQKKIEKFRESNNKLTKDLKEKEKEVLQLVKKIEKLQQSDRSLERELATVTNISKLNITISALKIRETELLEKIQIYEQEKERNFNCLNNNVYLNTNHSNFNNYNSNLQNNLNLHYNYARVNNNNTNSINQASSGNQNFSANQFSESENNSFNIGVNNPNLNVNYYNPNNYNNTNTNGTNQSGAYCIPKNQNNNNFNNNNCNNNENLNNNLSYNPLGNSAVNNSNQNKDLLVEKYEMDLKRIQEENFYLKDQNFRLVSENNKINEISNSFKSKVAELDSEKESLIREKNQLVDSYEKLIGELKEELDKQRNLGNKNVDEMRENLKNIQDMNTKLSDQFNSLQNKFYVQTQLIQEKNIELQSEKKIIDSLKKDNEELIENQTKILEKLKKLEKQNLINTKEKEKVKKELTDVKEKLSDLQLKSNFTKSELEERNKILNEENSNLRETNTQLKNKIQDVYEEIRQKDNKLITSLKEEARDIENKMRSEINELRIENEQLLKERSSIRLQFNEIKYENDLLKEQISYNNTAGVNFRNLFDAAKMNVNASNSSAIIQNEIPLNIPVNNNQNIVNNNINNSNNLANNNISNFISYLNPSIMKTSTDQEKIKNAILNQNNSHMQEIIKDNKFLEQENDYIKNENSKLLNELDILSKRLVSLENNLKDSKLEYDALLIEKDKLADLLHRREIEIKDIKLENNILQNEIENFKLKLDDYIRDINVKNQTINKLLDNTEHEKNISNRKLMDMEESILILKNEGSKFEEKYENLLKESKIEKDKFKFDLADLRKENEILIHDLEKKEIESTKQIEALQKELNELYFLHLENKKISEKMQQENSELKEEKIMLDTQVNELSVLSLERLEKQNEKMLKSKKKLEKLVELYESHIKFLKEKFDSSLHDFILSVNFKQGNLNDKDTEKFKSIMKNLENTSELMNQIAGREALIVNYKDEIKSFKQNLNKISDNLKITLREKEDLQAIVNVKKLQMKIVDNPKNKITSNTNKEASEHENANNEKTPICKNCVQKNLKIENLLRENNDLKIDEKEIEINANQFKAEIKKLDEINKDLSQKYETAQKYIENLRVEISKKEKELLDVNKLHKNEVGKIIEELKKIKEKWISPEKHNEKLEELEAKLKTLKNENTRKSDMIGLLKSQLAQSQMQNTSFANNTVLLNNTNNPNQSNLIANNKSIIESQTNFEEKVKALQKEINRKDTAIKEFKTNLENLRNSEKKLSEENSSLLEKNKIFKIDINRKDEIIKDYKDKLNLLNLSNKNQSLSNLDRSAIGDNNTNSNSNFNNDDVTIIKNQNKKLKNDLERKDDIIRTLKAKLENANNEIEQMKTLSIKNSKNNFSELEKEQKRNENLRGKMDTLLMKNENLISIIRRVFKDLIFTYEKNMIKNKMNLIDKNSLNYKDGMDILNISADELEDYLNPSDDNKSSNKKEFSSKTNLNNIKNAYDSINQMLDSENIDSDAFVDFFYSIRDKILENNNNNNYGNNLNKAFNNLETVANNNFLTNNIRNTNSASKNTLANHVNNNQYFNTNPNKHMNNISTISAINHTNLTNQKQLKNNMDSSFNTPVTNDTEPKLKKYQNLLNKVKANDHSNYNASFDNINFDGIMNDLQKIKK